MAFRSERRFISIKDIQTGMMLEFNYTKVKDGKQKTYEVLVIDPDKVRESTGNDQLHGILINKLSDQELYLLAVALGKNFNFDVFDPDVSSIKDSSNTFTGRRAPLGEYDNDEAYEKFKSRYYKDNIYRTFNLSNMSSIRQIVVGTSEEIIGDQDEELIG